MISSRTTFWWQTENLIEIPIAEKVLRTLQLSRSLESFLTRFVIVSHRGFVLLINYPFPWMQSSLVQPAYHLAVGVGFWSFGCGSSPMPHPPGNAVYLSRPGRWLSVQNPTAILITFLIIDDESFNLLVIKTWFVSYIAVSIESYNCI